MTLRSLSLLVAFSLFGAVGCSGSTAPESPEPPAQPEPETEPDAAPAPTPDARVNLNTATEAELKAIPGMTPRMVHEFEEYRPYVSIQQFRKEIGKYVDAEQVAKWEPHVFVPVAYDECDAATLQQLPGVDEAAAKTLMEGRPYGDRDAFLKALEETAGAEQAEAGSALVP